MSLVEELIDNVVSLVQAKLKSLTALGTLDGRKIWFDVRQAVGPHPVNPSQTSNGFSSSIKLMGYRQYVTVAPDEVRSVIKAAGGEPVEDG
jgi:hypothetical protein